MNNIIYRLSVKCFNVAAAELFSLSVDHTLSEGRVFEEALNPERMPVKPGSWVLLGYYMKK